MAGCYGNDSEDRYFESMLFRYLEEQEAQEYDPTEEEEYDDLFGNDDAPDTLPPTDEE